MLLLLLLLCARSISAALTTAVAVQLPSNRQTNYYYYYYYYYCSGLLLSTCCCRSGQAGDLRACSGFCHYYYYYYYSRCAAGRCVIKRMFTRLTQRTFAASQFQRYADDARSVARLCSASTRPTSPCHKDVTPKTTTIIQRKLISSV